MTRKKTIILLFLFAITVFAAATLCIQWQRHRNGNRDLTVLEEESTVEIQTVEVEDDDAGKALYEALNIARSGTDMDIVIKKLEQSADLGNSDAMYFLGELYFQGKGVEADLKKADLYFRKACESGNRKAMTIYGKMLFMGDGAAQNYDESVSCFYTASVYDGEAAYILGVMSNLGMGMPQSAERAQKYIEKAVQLGYEKAQDYQGKIRDFGRNINGAGDFQLTAKKVCDLDYKAMCRELQDLVDQYQTVIKSTEFYSAFDREMEELSGVDLTDESVAILFGNNGYLFYNNENDGTSVHDYIGDNHFSEEEMKNIAQNLEMQKKWIEQNGSELILLLLPNKETLYPENMPSYINRINSVTREDQLAEYLKKNTDIRIVYVKDILEANKEAYPLYYKTDTHANMVGSLFMVSELFWDCYGVRIEPDLDKFDIHLQNYKGDLARMANCTDRYASDQVYFYPKGAVGEEEKIESSIMLVGDSFGEFINIEAEYYLKGGVDYRMVGEYAYDYHSATEAGFVSSKPEYVVWEYVERYLDRLK